MTASSSSSQPASAPAPRAPSETFENVACPFCGILCDDLEIRRDGSKIKVLKNGCARATAGFERPVAAANPQIAGRDVTREAAVAEAARLLRDARLPLFGGLGTDVEGMRAVMATAERAGGVVDHALSDGQYRNFEVLQTSGWFMSTLTETRNRADLLIVLGSDVHRQHHRFFERIVTVEHPMFLAPGETRTVVFIGERLDTSAAKGGCVGDVLTLACPNAAVGEVVSAMRARLKGTVLPVDAVAGIPLAQIDDLVERCRKARYGVMVWAPPSLSYPSADLTVRTASDLIKDLNTTTRFAGLSLGGNEGAASAGAVATWQSGYPLRVSYATGKPHYDRDRFSANRLIASGETDLLLWIASITPKLLPPPSTVPTILLATPGTDLKPAPAVFIPVGTPGIDHSGRMVRCDNVVALPLMNLHRSTLPSVADVLASIERAL